MGSGKLVKMAIEKYGISNFKKEVLWLCESFEELKDFEAGIITKKFLEDNETGIYNLLVGGQGGFYYVNKKGLSVPIKFQIKDYISHNKHAGEMRRLKLKNNPVFREEYCKNLSIGANNYYKTHNGHMNGKKQTQEAVEHQKQIFKKIGHSKGAKNSQFGKCWIYNPSTKENQSIKQKDLEFWFGQGWIKGRKMKSIDK